MLKANKVTSQGYLQSKDINRILIVISFRDLLAGTKFETIQIFCVRQQRKGKKTAKFFHLFEKKGTKFMRIYQNPTKRWSTGMKQSYPSDIYFAPLGSSASIQKKKKVSTFEPFASFLLF